MQRDHFAQDADGLVGEGVEVLGVDAGGGFGCHDGGAGRVTEKGTEVKWAPRVYRMFSSFEGRVSVCRLAYLPAILRTQWGL